ncbi:RagB/SusD family nutrient uptake outer membrane protein [Pedobacter punctiformis]|uniref:RagB/SusD family nutrient uptake outer membrane protein n=1 Tax=Pedobacter punctiformis TaxID=3004097 RepID=A0ABT4LAJ8_9SPHI|nr:RagB/SusD family nutrient uptake outer membrane protein [Pedobacter sp. HCMS5-2]MCZ4244188.1 RagB/SusD family nutrient uptake outer membrane protein [Pedobacter sp. HCMS5-2]
MKKFIYTLLFAFFSCLMLTTGCKKMIEDGPLENANKDLVFDKTDSLGKYAEEFLNNIYSTLPKGYNRIGNNLLDAGSDDALPSSTADIVQFYSNGAFNQVNLPDNTWDANYAGIRKVNEFLANIDQVPLKTPGFKQRWKAEARGLRAMFYFELIKRWGGVPIIGDNIYDLSSNLNLPRNTYQECVNYINTEIKAILPFLISPNTTSSYTTIYFGRFTTGAALALRSRLMLYAASPLNNPSNDLSKWTAAATAAKDVMDSVTANKFVYALSTATTTAHYTTTNMAALAPTGVINNYVAGVNKFLNVFSNRYSAEIILPYLQATNTGVEYNNEPIGYTRGGLGKTNPTQELVNEFETFDGKMIADNGSGYSLNNPYYNRDPRLASSVSFNGLYWLTRNVQTYDGGLDRPKGYGNATSGETRTGYYLRKFMTGTTSESAYTVQNHNFPIFRYAEILLNYAEAQNEAVGPDGNVYGAINAIRSRVNMPALPAGLTQNEMRLRIRHERRVEMAFEEQRFWDIRRWKIAENVLNGTLHGIQATLSGGTTTYKIVDAAPVKFEAGKMYLFPIPFKESAANNKMVQNPNW